MLIGAFVAHSEVTITARIEMQLEAEMSTVIVVPAIIQCTAEMSPKKGKKNCTQLNRST